VLGVLLLLLLYPAKPKLKPDFDSSVESRLGSVESPAEWGGKPIAPG